MGRCSDYLSAYVVEIPAGGELKLRQHMHDELTRVTSCRLSEEELSRRGLKSKMGEFVGSR